MAADLVRVRHHPKSRDPHRVKKGKHLLALVLHTIPPRSTRVRDVHRSLIPAEGNPRRPPQPVRHDPQVLRLGVEPIDATGQDRLPAEVQLEAAARVREPQRAVARPRHVVRRVEVAPVEPAHQRLGRLAPRHVVQPAGARGQAALRAQDHPGPVGRAARGHGHGGRGAELLPLCGDHVVAIAVIAVAAGGGGASPVQPHPRDEHYGKAAAAGGLQQVGGDIKLVVLRDKYTGLVKEWVSGRLGRREQQGVATVRVETCA